MVSSIKKPANNSIDTLTSVLNEKVKYKDFYKRIKTDLIEHYKHYITAHGNPTKITPLNLNDYTDTSEDAIKRKKTLINLYNPDKNNNLFLILFNMRRNHELLFCPTCGQTVVPNTLDHYLPKDKFPELSIMLLNLVPMCTDCQGEKGTEYLTIDSNKKFIHPYFDIIDEPLFEVKFTPPYNEPTFEVLINDHSLTSKMNDLVKSHIEGVGLNTRYLSYCKSKYMHLLKMARRARLSALNNSLVDTLTRSLTNEEDKTKNCWEAVFYRSVLKDNDLLNYLTNGVLPENI